MNDSKKNVWTVVLTVVKYAVTLLLGYISGDSGVFNTLF